MARTVNREPRNTRSSRSRSENADNGKSAATTAAPTTAEAAGPSKCNNVNDNDDCGTENFVQRRVLRSRYLNVMHRISDERDDISKVDSDKFNAIIEEVESLHQHVQKPREQVADAEALLDIASSLVSSVKAHSNEGVTPSDFVSCLLRDFGRQGGTSNNADEERISVCWKNIGRDVSHLFLTASGITTMFGPMDTELKQRRPVVRRTRTRATESSRPEELENVNEEKTDTDKNMATMFNILRKNRRVRLENLILNRNSFAQTVENLFSLSFLVKDGRAEITVDEKGFHFVAPKNAPAASSVLSGEVSYSHFVFRFDFRDWKLMLSSVNVGEELMPHRNDVNNVSNSQPDSASEEPQEQVPTTPIRKLSRNRGRVLQEQQSVVEDSPETDNISQARRGGAIRKGKRKLT